MAKSGNELYHNTTQTILVRTWADVRVHRFLRVFVRVLVQASLSANDAQPWAEFGPQIFACFLPGTRSGLSLVKCCASPWADVRVHRFVILHPGTRSGVTAG